MSYQIEMARLREQLERAQEEILFKDNILYDIAEAEQSFPSDWHLYDYDRRILGALTRKGVCRHEQLITAIYWDKDEDDWPENYSSVMTITLSRLRKKMEIQGIVIPKFAGGQIAMGHDDLVRLRAILRYGVDLKGLKSRKRPVQADTRQMSLFSQNSQNDNLQEGQEMAVAS